MEQVAKPTKRWRNKEGQRRGRPRTILIHFIVVCCAIAITPVSVQVLLRDGQILVAKGRYQLEEVRFLEFRTKVRRKRADLRLAAVARNGAEILLPASDFPEDAHRGRMAKLWVNPSAGFIRLRTGAMQYVGDQHFQKVTVIRVAMFGLVFALSAGSGIWSFRRLVRINREF